MADRLSRRRLLGAAGATLGTALACPWCPPAVADEWGYDGDHGPARWAKLKPEFSACASGTKQAPIDLRAPANGTADAVKRAYPPIPLTIVNNGHTIQVNVAPNAGCRITLDGARYDLQQFHFHHPSEHLLSGEASTLEAHFVHRSASGKFAVLGVFYEVGSKPLAALEPIWAALPAEEGPERTVSGVTIAPAKLFPASQTHFRYDGSLTTPPCTEGLSWAVYAQRVEISRGQGEAFAKLFPHNARPVQPLNGRPLMIAE